MAIRIGNEVFNSKSDFIKWCSIVFKNHKNIDINNLWDSLNTYSQISNRSMGKVNINTTVEGKLVLQKGTLLHGIRTFNEDILKSISSNGIIYEGFFENKATTQTLGEACFFEVDSEQTMQDYYLSYNRDTKGENIGETPYVRVNKENKQVAMLRRESGYLPREGQYWIDGSSNSIAFIINPSDDIDPIVSQRKKIPQFARRI